VRTPVLAFRSTLVTCLGVLAGAAVLAGPAQAGTVTVIPTLNGAGTIGTTSGYGCTLAPAILEPKNTDNQMCLPTSASSSIISIGGVPIFRNGVVALTAIPRTGWQFMEWQACNSVSGATCTSTASIVTDDYTTTPKAIFKEIVPVSLGEKPAVFTADNTPQFGFSTPVTGSGFKCKIDITTLACPGTGSSSLTLASALADGTHTFQVVGVHNTNESIVSASYTFVVDTHAPDTSFNPASGPGEGALQTATSETFQLVSSEPAGARFECSLDGAAFAACDSTVSLTGLAPGQHSFQARTTDRAGNVDPAAVRRTWTIAVPDADGDGFNANIDCNDTVAAVHPGANDAAGNGVDENCDGADASSAGGPSALGATRTPEQVIVTIAFFAAAKKTTTKFTTLQVKNVPFGATVHVTCSGKACAPGLKGKGFTKKNAFGTVSLAKFIKKSLRAGDVITVLVSKPGAINAVKTIKLRPSKKPLIATKCQPPGAKAPVAC
jgi:hypothetical protein